MQYTEQNIGMVFRVVTKYVAKHALSTGNKLKQSFFYEDFVEK
jgi:hypothetical protein